MRAVVDAGNRKVGILGLSFKAGSDDLRESPVVELAEGLIGKGFDVRIYDRNVSMAHVGGQNRDYVLNRIPHVARLLAGSIEEIVEQADTIVIGNAAPEFAAVAHQISERQQLIDLVRIDDRATSGSYEGICW